MMNVKKSVMVLMGLVCIFIASSGWAQEGYPKKPITIVLTFPPGASMDLSNRMIAEKMERSLGQPVTILHKPGGAAMIAVNYVLNLPPDGYTILAGSNRGGMQIVRMLMSDCPYKPSDWTLLGTYYEYIYVLVCNKNLPVKDLRELRDYIKKNPGTTWASAGPGALMSYTGIFLLDKLGVGGLIEPVPYTSVATILPAVLGNHSQFGVVPFSSVISKHISGNELRALAVTGAKRHFALPEVPTAIEQGVEVDMTADGNFMVLAKTPTPIIKKLESTIEKIAQDKDLQGQLKQLYMTPKYYDSLTSKRLEDNFAKTIEPVVKKSGAKIE